MSKRRRADGPARPRSCGPRAIRVWVRDGKVWIELEDGREIGFPATKFPRLRGADEALLARVGIEARGRALRWEELDEDISVAGILAGRFGPESAEEASPSP